jgi:sugar phosphate isomerase/epimerase
VTRLAVSNIAWPADEWEAAYACLAAHSVRGLEVAPSLAFWQEPDPFTPSGDAVRAFHARVAAHGLELVSMQSLLYGVLGASLFGDAEGRRAFVQGLLRAASFAGRVGIPNMVLGAPAARSIPDGMGRADAEAVAADVFREIGDACVRAGTLLALEPNDAAYGTNFLVTVREAAAFVRAVGHPAVTLNFDLGTVRMNGQDGIAGELFGEVADVTSHAHLSDAHLAPVGPALGSATSAVAVQGVRAGYGGWYSVEMRAVPGDPVRAVGAAVEASLAALAVGGAAGSGR